MIEINWDYNKIYNQLLSTRKSMDSSILIEKKRKVWEYFRNIGVPLINIEKNMVVPCSLFKAPLDDIIAPFKLIAYPIDNDYQIYINEKLFTNENNNKLVMCQLTHEVLHILIQKINGIQFSFCYGSTHVGIEEAASQIFTEEIENRVLNKEEDKGLYFLKNILRVFKAIIGTYELAYQYTNNGTLFEEKFNEITGNKFKKFNQYFYEIYYLIKKEGLNIISKEELNYLIGRKEQLLKFTKKIINDNLNMLPNIIKELEGTDFLEVLELKENIKK